jgi:hypothetical protein
MGRDVAATLDTLALAKDFAAAGFNGAQAEALAVAMRQVQDIDLSELATRADLSGVESSLRSDMREVEMRLKGEIGACRTDVMTALAETRAEIYNVMLAQTVVIIGAVVGLLKMGGH